MEFAEFLRTFEVRSPNLMWFLGAGCSISAGIPSANDIIWDCKSRIYCSEQGVPRATVADITNPLIQSVIQDTLTRKNIYPKTEEDGDDYTYYFQKAISSQADRRHKGTQTQRGQSHLINLLVMGPKPRGCPQKQAIPR